MAVSIAELILLSFVLGFLATQYEIRSTVQLVFNARSGIMAAQFLRGR